MAKVICSLPNAATKINGIQFTADRGQMISEEVSDDMAAKLAAIPGYDIVGLKKPPAPKPPKAGDPPPAGDDPPPAA